MENAETPTHSDKKKIFIRTLVKMLRISPLLLWRSLLFVTQNTAFEQLLIFLFTSEGINKLYFIRTPEP